jgi:hypothetical protein
MSAGLTRLIQPLALMTIIKNLGRHTKDKASTCKTPGIEGLPTRSIQSERYSRKPEQHGSFGTDLET